MGTQAAVAVLEAVVVAVLEAVVVAVIEAVVAAVIEVVVAAVEQLCLRGIPVEQPSKCQEEARTPAAGEVGAVLPGAMSGFTKECSLSQGMSNILPADRQSNENTFGRAHAAITSTIPSEVPVLGAMPIVQPQRWGLRQAQQLDIHTVTNEHQFPRRRTFLSRCHSVQTDGSVQQ